MSSIYEWSLQANKNVNSDIAINWQEGQPPSTVNNSARAMMQRMAEYVQDNLSQLQQFGSADALDIESNAISDKLLDGLRINFFAKENNTKSVTINYNHLGAKQVFKRENNNLMPLSANDIIKMAIII